MTSYRPSRAHNPWEPILSQPPVAVCDDGVPESGKRRQELGQLEGRAYKASSPYGWTADATQERAKIEWLVRAKPGTDLNIVVRHERAGTLRTTVHLN